MRRSLQFLPSLLPHPLYPSLLAPQTSVRRTQGVTQDRRGTLGFQRRGRTLGKEGPGSLSRQAGGLDGRVGHLGQRDLLEHAGKGDLAGRLLWTPGVSTQRSGQLIFYNRAPARKSAQTLQKIITYFLRLTASPSASASASLSSSMASTVSAQGPYSASSPPPFCPHFCPSISLYCSSCPLPFLPSLLLPPSPVPQ